jgi:hypothetical protein
MAGRAQQPAMPVIGFFHLTSLETNRDNLATFRQGLADTGYIEGKNVAIQYRWAQGRNDICCRRWSPNWFACMCPSWLYWRAQMVRLQPKRPPKQSRSTHGEEALTVQDFKAKLQETLDVTHTRTKGRSWWRGVKFQE